MILCPNCLSQEMIGALFCSECGLQLVHETGIATTMVNQTSPTTGQIPIDQPKTIDTPSNSSSADAILSLNLVSSGEFIHLTERKIFTLGRVSKGQPIVPDIDMTPYKAYEAGVSRMHLSINLSEKVISVTDLGSINGTRINGRKISAHTPHPIKNGDILTLGKLKIQILLRNKNNGG